MQNIPFISDCLLVCLFYFPINAEFGFVFFSRHSAITFTCILLHNVSVHRTFHLCKVTRIPCYGNKFDCWTELTQFRQSEAQRVLMGNGLKKIHQIFTGKRHRTWHKIVWIWMRLAFTIIPVRCGGPLWVLINNRFHCPKMFLSTKNSNVLVNLSTSIITLIENDFNKSWIVHSMIITH